MAKILILGARGFLGSHLVKYAPPEHQIIASARDHAHIPEEIKFLALDILEGEHLIQEISTLQPDVIINCVAITLPDYAEKHQEETQKVNVEGVANIIKACQATGAKLIHLSTDYVFNGEKGNYQETDSPQPVNFYGQTKLKAEKLIQQSNISYLICRTAVLFGIPQAHQRKELFMGYYSALKEGKHVKATNQIASVTLVDHLARALYQVIDFKESGILHIAGSKPLSRYDFATLIAETLDLNKDLIEFVPSLPKRARRPQNSSLNVSKLRAEYGISFPAPKTDIWFLKKLLEIGVH